WFFGVSAEGIGTVGMVLNFVVTFIVSRMTPPPPLEIQEMVEDLRSPLAVPVPISHIGESELD
ncbi:MAG: cation acetate symporter, partial [Trichodesmium sp. St17_bin3_1_1]|nr:cation acetate symporter [Trichodesmium sp. St17_bin3_1_1]